ncbi:MAG: PAS domain S-box protein [Chloroflexota bacterium]
MSQTAQHQTLEAAQAEIAALHQRIAELEQQVAASEQLEPPTQNGCASEQQQVAKTLPVQETIYQAMFENNQAIKLLVDPQTGAIVDANPAASAFYGYELELLRQKNISDLNILSSVEIHTELQQAQAGKRPYVLFRHKLASGEIRDVEVYTGPIDVRGRTLLFSIIHDITERKKAEEALRDSEERYRTVADWTYDWEYWIDPDGQYRYISPSCECITGYSAIEFQHNPQLMESIVHPDDRALIQHHLHGEVQHQKACEVTFRIIARDGREVWIGHVCQPVYASDKRWLGQRASNRDITKQIQAEEALRESQERYRIMVEETDDLITQVDTHGQFMFVNHTVERIYGLSITDCIGRSAFDFVHPDDRERTQKAFARWTSQHKTGITFENRQISISGEIRHMLWTINPHYDSDGHITVVNSIARDITELRKTEETLHHVRDKLEQHVIERTTALAQTNRALQLEIEERKRTEEALRESEERYRRLTENAQDIIYRVSCVPTQRFEYVSPSAYTITGYTLDEYYTDLDLSVKLIHPEDRQTQTSLISSDVPFSNPVVLRWVRKDGSYVWIEQRNTPIYDECGMLVAIEGIARDISQRKLTEETLASERAAMEATIAERTRELQYERDRTRAILESLGDAVLVVDMDGVIQYVNPAAVTLTGFHLGDGNQSEQRWWLWQHTNPHEPMAQMQQAVHNRQTWRGEVVLKRVDGSYYNASVTVAPLFDPDVSARPIGFVSVQRDITTLKDAERMKDQFVSNVSHELRTPMSLITMLSGSLEMLYPRLDHTKRLEIIRDIRKHARVLSDLIGDVLEISRIDSGRVDSKHQDIDITHLAKEEIESLHPMAQKKAITIHMHTNIPLYTTGHAGQLRQVIRNLMNNAIKYTPDGGTVSCTCAIFDGTRSATHTNHGAPTVWAGNMQPVQGYWASFCIEDTGIGILPVDLPHIFERFYRAATQGDIPGTGLGLSIAWELVKRHAGHLAVSSAPDQGSRFFIYLPLKEQ